MKREHIQCLLINYSEELHADLINYLQFQDVRVKISAVKANEKALSHTLNTHAYQVIFINDKEDKAIKSLVAHNLHRHHPDTIIIFLSNDRKSRALTVHKSGLERCIIAWDDIANNTPLLHVVLSYSHLKSQFRDCKRLLHTTEKRGHWLVSSSREAVAYLHNNNFIQGNAAFLSLVHVNHQKTLRNIPVDRFVHPSDRAAFQAFIRNHSRDASNSYVLHLNLQTIRGNSFRANIRAIPTVLSGIRCMQIWIKPTTLSIEEAKKANIAVTKTKPNHASNHTVNNSTDSNNVVSKTALVGADNTPAKEHDSINLHTNKKIVNKKQRSHDDLNNQTRKALQDILKTTSPKIATTRLAKTHKKLPSLELCNLALPAEPVHSINKLLKSSGGVPAIIFWERILLTLTQRRAKQVNSQHQHCMVSLSSETIFDKQFATWFTKHFNQHSSPQPELLIGISIEHLQNSKKDITPLIHTIKLTRTPIVLENFTPSLSNISLLEKIQPSYIWISRSWIELAVLDNNTLEQFDMMNQHIEKLGIQIIIPSIGQFDMMSHIQASYIYHEPERVQQT